MAFAHFDVRPAHADTFGSGLNTFDIEFVRIGNPGNAADTDDGSSNQGGIQNFGSVGYSYNMGKNEVSRDMVTKANAPIASGGGNLGITLADMTSFGGNVASHPATGVSWNEAARFVNWLNTSQGFAPAYKFSTQQSDGGYGANHDIFLWESGDAGFNAANPYRNSQAHYFLPSVDEWYKAAYYDPSLNGGGGGYWDYPTGSNSAPTAVASGTAAGTAVYNLSTSTGPADITLAGGLSPYGTMGQGGNADEFEETAYDLVNDFGWLARGDRGGAWVSVSVSGDLHATSRFAVNPSIEIFFGVGFRVASIAIPEPGSLLLLCIGALGFAVLRRRQGLQRMPHRIIGDH